MNKERWNLNDLPLDLLEDILGKVNVVEWEGTGIHYLSVSGSENWSSGEYYAVWESAPDISTEATDYGLSIKSCSGLLLYPFARDDSGWRIIQYELYRYRTANNLPLPEKDAFINATLYGKEIHPKYFGAYPIPTMTPWGCTLRHKALGNGIYWLETNQCKHVLAVCAPIWEELSNAAAEFAIQIKYDTETGIISPLFFEKQTYCIPIWELMKRRREWETKIVDKAALMNAIWQSFPEYATVYNTQVQQGLHDTAGLLLNTVGIETDLSPNIDDTISISPQVKGDFLLFK